MQIEIGFLLLDINCFTFFFDKIVDFKLAPKRVQMNANKPFGSQMGPADSQAGSNDSKMGPIYII